MGHRGLSMSLSKLYKKESVCEWEGGVCQFLECSCFPGIQDSGKVQVCLKILSDNE